MSTIITKPNNPYLKNDRIGFKLSFSLKLSLMFSMIILIIISMLSVITYLNEKNTLMSELDKRSQLLTNIIAKSSADAILTSNYEYLRYITVGLDTQDKNNKEIQYCMIINTSGKVLMHTDISQIGKIFADELSQKVLDTKETTNFNYIYENKNLVEVSTPIISAVGIAGYVRIGFDLTPMEDKLTSFIIDILVTSIFCIIISVIFIIIIAKMFTKGIRKIASATNNLADGDLTKEININSSDEIGVLCNSFDMAIKELNILIKSIIVISDDVNNVGKEISNNSSNSVAISDLMVATIGDVVNGLNEQSRVINNTTSIILGMDNLIQEINYKADIVKNTSNNTVAAAQEGGKSVDFTVIKINEINIIVNQLSAIVKELERKSSKISEILNVMSQISSQTNLLALNASIEAARAGEHGKGFSVVAEEIRKLAEQSTLASKEISNLVHEIQESTGKVIQSTEENFTKVLEGTAAINKTQSIFQNIIVAAEQASDKIKEISQATDDQANNSKEVINAMNSLANASVEGVESADIILSCIKEQNEKLIQNESSTKTLDNIASELQNKVKQFKV